jgi:threonine/homoserine/homoserine lactone efflux protein
MRSIAEFLLVAAVVTVTPGPATATIIRVAATDGRRAALGAMVGNSIGVLVWAVLSAVGVSALILASEIAFAVLKFGGAAVLVFLGLRSLLRRRQGGGTTGGVYPGGFSPGGVAEPARRAAGWRTGLLTSLSNPKLAVFFVALFPQFLQPGSAVLPAALAMAGVITALDLVWYSTLAYAVDRARTALRPRVQRVMERCTGAVMVALGVRLAVDPR